MNKDDIAAMFETDFTNPGSYKSGEYLKEQVLNRAKQIAPMKGSFWLKL